MAEMHTRLKQTFHGNYSQNILPRYPGYPDPRPAKGGLSRGGGKGNAETPSLYLTALKKAAENNKKTYGFFVSGPAYAKTPIRLYIPVGITVFY
jgi:hypothetical protein